MFISHRLPGLRRWLVALTALLSGAGVAAGLLLVDGSDAGAGEYLVVARDVPAGGVLAPDALASRRLRLGETGAVVLPAGAMSSLLGRRAAHDLAAGQLLQKPDVSPADSAGDRRLVWLPLKDLPPLAPGDRLDLLQVAGPPEHLVVTPFALGLTVEGTVAGGVVVAAASREAPALLYGVAAARLVAVVAPHGAAAGQEGPVSSLEQAQALLRP